MVQNLNQLNPLFQTPFCLVDLIHKIKNQIGIEKFMFWGLKGVISIDADSSPLSYVP